MKIYNDLVQGSPEWLKLREEYSTASEAPSIFNESKYKSRTELMDEKKGVKQEISNHLQKLFDKGHETEAKARDLLEFEMAETFTPITATVEIEGVKLLASLDGINEDHTVLFEHKLWNETLAENVRRGVLEPTYYRQLDQQLLVTGAEYVLFVVSDGTDEKREMMEYQTTPEKQEELISGWKQFNKDLAKHEVEAKKEKVIAVKRSLPVITYKVAGSEIETNIKDVLKETLSLVEIEMNKTLETDQDFANKDSLNKEVKATRAKLKEAVASVRGEFVSYSQFEAVANELDSALQKMQSSGEKQVKKAKEDKKNAIEQKANRDGIQFIKECEEKIKPMSIIQIMNYPEPNYPLVMKNKRTIESLQNAVDSELARFKLEINEVMDLVIPNLEFLRVAAKDHRFLFADAQSLVNQSSEAFQAIVNSRISEHKKAEEEKLEKERQKIKAEEEAKATELANKKIKDAENLRLAEIEAYEHHELWKQEKAAKEESESLALEEVETPPVTINYVVGQVPRASEQNAPEAAEIEPKQEVNEPEAQNNVPELLESESEPHTSSHDKLNRLMYALTKHAARNSFVEFLEEWELSMKDYDEVKGYLNSNLGEVKTYL